jgi:2-polyprenyl-3-methyl-5-hydroxy-6-metoxy-1,4-benzoquinol methylase
MKSYYKNLNTVYSYQFRNIVKKIPLGQINYHKKNFQYYLNLKIKNFRNKKILDTGAGSGIHSCILSLMGAHVFATDILQSNINKIKKFKKIYKFKNMEVFKHDFTKKLKSYNNFELISCHNWIQHTPKPSDTLYNIIQNLEVGGKIYVSCYHANTFRFYITQAARQILKISDFSLLKKRMKNIFKDGF